MSAIATETSHGLAQAPHGSLHAMKLGGQTLDQLAEIVNWDNSATFALRELKPWAALDEAKDPKALSSPPRPTSVTAPGAIQPVTTSENSAIEPVNTIEHTPDSEADSLVSLASQSMPNLSQPSEQASKTHDDVLAKVPETDKEVETRVFVDEMNLLEEDSPGVHEDEKLTSAVDTIPQSTRDSAVQSAISYTGSVESQSVSMQPTEPANSGQYTDTKRTATAPAKRPVSFKANAMLPKSIMPSSPSSTSGDQNYLHRLESLVLELNLQLAQVNNPIEGDADYTQWLSQRVIDLSLQNMALQEELAKHRTK